MTADALTERAREIADSAWCNATESGLVRLDGTYADGVEPRDLVAHMECTAEGLIDWRSDHSAAQALYAAVCAEIRDAVLGGGR